MVDLKKRKKKRKNYGRNKKQTALQTKKHNFQPKGKPIEEIKDHISKEKQPGATILLIKGNEIFELTTLGKKLKESPESFWSMLKAIAIGSLDLFLTTDENLENFQKQNDVRLLLSWNHKELKESYEEIEADRFDILTAALGRRKPKNLNFVIRQLYGIVKTLVYNFAGSVTNIYDPAKIETEARTRCNHFLLHHVFRIRKYVPSARLELLEIKPAIKSKTEVNVISHELKQDELPAPAQEVTEISVATETTDIAKEPKKPSRRKRIHDNVVNPPIMETATI